MQSKIYLQKLFLFFPSFARGNIGNQNVKSIMTQQTNVIFKINQNLINKPTKACQLAKFEASEQKT